MKDYMDAVKAAGIGRTPQLCQDALIEMLEELFAGKKYNGQQGRKPLNIYKQDLPVPEDYDADVDTDAAAAPYIVARMTGGAIKDESGPQTVEFKSGHVGMVQRRIGSSSSHTVTERGRPRWRNKDGKVEKLVTMGSPSATAMHSTVWPYVEPEVTEYLYDRLMEQTERVIARAKARKG